MDETTVSREDLRAQGFVEIQNTLDVLTESLAQALESVGEKELVDFIPWRGDLPSSTPPEGIVSVKKHLVQILLEDFGQKHFLV